MANKKTPLVAVKKSEDFRVVSGQVRGFSPVIAVVAEYAPNVRAYLAQYGAAVIFQRSPAGQSETPDVADRRMRARADAWAAGMVETERSPIRNWEDLFTAIAEVTGRALADVRAGVKKDGTKLSGEEWVKASQNLKVREVIARLEQERATRALADGGDTVDDLADLFGDEDDE